MRFNLLSSVYVVLFLITVGTLTNASHIEISKQSNTFLQRRAEAGNARSSPAATATAAITSSTSTETSEHKGGKGTNTDDASQASSSPNTSTEGHGGEQNQKKHGASSSFGSPEILQGGTLFYVGVSVTTLLWVTGKAIDIQTERQERYAERLVHSL